jgi:8-oxo-dGTP pyrophosphatase MutT (NUDIX family)
MLPHDEIIDQLDDNGTIIGPVSRAALLATGSKNYRLASALLRTHDGNFIMFRRAYHKTLFPGLFGAVGGCVQSGETYQEGFAREVLEEIGINVHNYPWKLIGYTTPKDDNTFGHVGLYEITCDSISSYNENDFAECRIFSFDELAQLCAENRQVTHNMPILFKKFYLRK